MLSRIRIVLVRPRRGGNVGSVARAMKNMGLSDLVLVAPRTRVGRSAERMAVHAGDVLAGRRVVADLGEAIGDCRLVAATVGRPTVGLDEPRPPREVAGELVATARRARVAVVFGPEDHGLSNAEIALCQRAIRIPTAPGYGSLNLAQAVVVCAYEVLLAAGATPPRDEVPAAGGRLATAREREDMIGHLSSALDRVGFLSAQNPEHILRDVRSLFARAGLTERDVRVWRGVARRVLWAVGAAPARRPRVAEISRGSVSRRSRGPS